MDQCAVFLKFNEENANYNQYWYSSYTIKIIIEDLCNHGGLIAFLSAPSLYFSLPLEIRKRSYVFDYDIKWKNDRGFVQYDYRESTNLPKDLLGSFDIIVIDPPFITHDVWKKYFETSKLLMKDPTTCKILLTTIDENQDLLKENLNVVPMKFKPCVPNLVYQYTLYTNYESETFNCKNPEIPDY